MAITPFKQGVNSPPCQQLHLVYFIYLHYLPSTLGIWFFSTSSFVQENRTECVKNSEQSKIFTLLISQQVRLATVLWMLAEHMKILGQRQRTLLIAVARVSAFSYTSSLSPNSYRVILNKIWPMYRFYFHEFQSRKTFLWLKEILQSWMARMLRAKWIQILFTD